MLTVRFQVHALLAQCEAADTAQQCLRVQTAVWAAVSKSVVLPLYKEALWQTAGDLLAVVQGRWENEEKRALNRIQEHSDLNCRLTATASVHLFTPDCELTFRPSECGMSILSLQVPGYSW